MIIKNASVYTEEGRFETRAIYTAGEVFASEPEEAEGEVIDGEGCFAIPGLTDIHFHGCAGHDFCDGTLEAIDRIARYEAGIGVTAIVPATMTMDEDTLYAACEAAHKYRQEQEAGQRKGTALLWGIHMEGPFFSAKRLGAQNPVYLRKPDTELYEEMQKRSGGMIRLVSLAPELEGAMEFIRRYKGEVILSLAHTAADYDTAMKAFEMGATHVTHLFNGMESFSHRAPGVPGAAADAGVEAELICDNVHLHPSVVRSAIRILGEDKVLLVSDSMRATGLVDGTYLLGEQQVTVTGNRAALAGGALAGSVTNLMQCMRIAVKEMGIPLETAVKCAAVNTAKSVGLYDRCGSISAGKYANLVLLDREDLSVRQVILRGEKILVEKCGDIR